MEIFLSIKNYDEKESEDLPGGPVAKSLPPNAGVWPLVWEDSTCCRASKLMHHNY